MYIFSGFFPPLLYAVELYNYFIVYGVKLS